MCLLLQLRLSPEQLDAKTALESAVEEVKQELAAESDDTKKDALTTELKEKESKLDTLMAEFEVCFPGPTISRSAGQCILDPVIMVSAELLPPS